MTRSEILAELMKLDPEERMQVAEELWESVANEPDSPFALSDEKLAEIKRRDAELEADPSIGISWEAVRARLLAKFG